MKKIVEIMSKCKNKAMAKQSVKFQSHLDTITEKIKEVTTTLSESKKKVCELKMTEIKTFFWKVRKQIAEYLAHWKLSTHILRTLGEKVSNNDETESEEIIQDMDDDEEFEEKEGKQSQIKLKKKNNKVQKKV